MKTKFMYLLMLVSLMIVVSCSDDGKGGKRDLTMAEIDARCEVVSELPHALELYEAALKLYQERDADADLQGDIFNTLNSKLIERHPDLVEGANSKDNLRGILKFGRDELNKIVNSKVFEGEEKEVCVAGEITELVGEGEELEFIRVPSDCASKVTRVERPETYENATHIVEYLDVMIDNFDDALTAETADERMESIDVFLGAHEKIKELNEDVKEGSESRLDTIEIMAQCKAADIATDMGMGGMGGGASASSADFSLNKKTLFDFEDASTGKGGNGLPAAANI